MKKSVRHLRAVTRLWILKISQFGGSSSLGAPLFQPLVGTTADPPRGLARGCRAQAAHPAPPLGRFGCNGSPTKGADQGVAHKSRIPGRLSGRAREHCQLSRGTVVLRQGAADVQLHKRWWPGDSFFELGE